ncbi:hypothetical protein [Thalassolituus maritimus]|uniref:hypothetical protein n=1 Tax=Thalassolituus maritimus TaxID=484498 RepID=UPI001115A10D|nr:hypothetical protein [Thalassolituus maritimus]
MSFIDGGYMKLRVASLLRTGVALAALLTAYTANAEGLKPNEVVPVMGGETYSKVARVDTEAGVLVYRYIRDTETFEDWTTAVTYTLYRNPSVGDRPKSVATVIVSSLQNSNPQAKYNLTGNDEGTEVVLDFLTWPADKEYMEYDVYRIESGQTGEGVYVLQFSVKFPYVENMSEAQVKELVTLRNGMVKQVLQYNMTSVKSMLTSRYNSTR